MGETIQREKQTDLGIQEGSRASICNISGWTVMNHSDPLSSWPFSLLCATYVTVQCGWTA